MLIGIGSAIAPNITIGKNSLIGAGSVVIRDVKANTQVFGNPAHEKNNWPQFSKKESDIVRKVLLSNKVNYLFGSEGKKFEKNFSILAIQNMLWR